MSKNTPEPWYSKGCHIMTILEGKEVQIARADLWKVGEDAQAANARRIVACVNAMAGVPTEDLEESVALGIKDPRTGNLFSSRMKLERKLADTVMQRDELLVAVENVFVELERLDASGDVGGWIFDEVELLRSAIAKAKGGVA